MTNFTPNIPTTQATPHGKTSKPAVEKTAVSKSVGQQDGGKVFKDRRHNQKDRRRNGGKPWLMVESRQGRDRRRSNATEQKGSFEAKA